MPRLPGVMFPYRLRRYRKVGETGKGGPLWEAQPTQVRAQVQVGKRLTQSAGGGSQDVKSAEGSLVLTTQEKLAIDEAVEWDGVLYRVTATSQAQAILTTRSKSWWRATAVQEQQL